MTARWTKNWPTVVFLGMAAIVAGACNDDAQDLYSTEYPCRFTFNTQLHPTSLITLALDNPGLIPSSMPYAKET